MEDRMVTIGLVQSAVSDDPASNMRHAYSAVRWAIEGGASIVCLQELYNSPYFPRLEENNLSNYAETIPGVSTDAFSKLAQEMHAVIIVPVYEKAEDGRYYNSAAVINTDGKVMPAYRKVHLPYDPFFYEQSCFSAGNSYRVYGTTFGRIGVLICYDQWFPEAARSLVLAGAEILFYPTAIGKISGKDDPLEGDWRSAWETVQRGHAIANGVHVAAVNRVGREGELHFWGSSFVCDAFGNVLARAGEDEEVLIVDLDLSMNRSVRDGWGFLRNRRPDTYASLSFPVTAGCAAGPGCPVRKRCDTPKKHGYHMPAEWERHDAVWLAWPYDPETFGNLWEVEESCVRIIRELASNEPVSLLVRDDAMQQRVGMRLSGAGVDLSHVCMHQEDYADVWFRDYGPTFVVNREKGVSAMVHWIFNAWGGKYEELIRDGAIPSAMNRHNHLPLFSPGIEMEGGSFDVNGSGTVITTEQCLLNSQRNPGATREEIEGFFDEYLGAGHVIWLKKGIAGDDTDGHVDDIARFVDEQTVVCAVEDDPEDENYAPLQGNYSVLQGSSDQNGTPLCVIPLPMPGRIGEEMRLPASYTNFYIGNSVVLVPVFSDPNDEKALMILRDVFPGRRVVGVDCRAMVHGLGAIHCITQQQPSV